MKLPASISKLIEADVCAAKLYLCNYIVYIIIQLPLRCVADCTVSPATVFHRAEVNIHTYVYATAIHAAAVYCYSYLCMYTVHIHRPNAAAISRHYTLTITVY